jgi:hypothetical protein
LQVKGRIWGCSKELKALKPYRTGEISEIGDTLHKLTIIKKVEVVDHEHFMIFFLNVEKFLKTYHPRVYRDMQRYYVEAYEKLYMVTTFEKAISDEVERLKSKGSLPPVQLSLFGEMILEDNRLRRMTNRLNH